jgi:hypothetical protein
MQTPVTETVFVIHALNHLEHHAVIQIQMNVHYLTSAMAQEPAKSAILTKTVPAVHLQPTTGAAHLTVPQNLKSR